jgi:hypothetical protein
MGLNRGDLRLVHLQETQWLAYDPRVSELRRPAQRMPYSVGMFTEQPELTLRKMIADQSREDEARCRPHVQIRNNQIGPDSIDAARFDNLADALHDNHRGCPNGVREVVNTGEIVRDNPSHALSIYFGKSASPGLTSRGHFGYFISTAIFYGRAF